MAGLGAPANRRPRFARSSEIHSMYPSARRRRTLSSERSDISPRDLATTPSVAAGADPERDPPAGSRAASSRTPAMARSGSAGSMTNGPSAPARTPETASPTPRKTGTASPSTSRETRRNAVPGGWMEKAIPSPSHPAGSPAPSSSSNSRRRWSGASSRRSPSSSPARRGIARVAVGTQVISAQRIDEVHDDVRAPRVGRRALAGCRGAGVGLRSTREEAGEDPREDTGEDCMDLDRICSTVGEWARIFDRGHPWVIRSGY